MNQAQGGGKHQARHAPLRRFTFDTVYRAPVVVGAVKQSLEASFDIVHHSSARGLGEQEAFVELQMAADAEVDCRCPSLCLSRETTKLPFLI